jgi:hypothetical protein
MIRPIGVGAVPRGTTVEKAEVLFQILWKILDWRSVRFQKALDEAA